MADEQLLPDLAVRQSIAGQPRDLGLADGQAGARSRHAGALPHRFPGGGELAGRTIGERHGSQRIEHLPSRPQLLARVDPAAFAAKPIPVDEVRAGQLDRQAGVLEMADRSAMEILSGLAVAQQRLAPRLHAEHPLHARS